MYYKASAGGTRPCEGPLVWWSTLTENIEGKHLRQDLTTECVKKTWLGVNQPVKKRGRREHRGVEGSREKEANSAKTGMGRLG